jgi:hypothetical protein
VTEGSVVAPAATSTSSSIEKEATSSDPDPDPARATATAAPLSWRSPSTPRPSAPTSRPLLRCAFCGRFCSALSRRGPLRNERYRRRARAVVGFSGSGLGGAR